MNEKIRSYLRIKPDIDQTEEKDENHKVSPTSPLSSALKSDRLERGLSGTKSKTGLREERPIKERAIEVVNERAIRDTTSNKMFEFETVFGPDSKNPELFQEIIEQYWGCLAKNIDFCVFTYGQTSSGKTHTMKGSPADPGMIFLCIENLFGKLEQQLKCKFEIEMGFFEVYNENIYDLLNQDCEKKSFEDRKSLDIRFDKNAEKSYIEGLTKKTLISAEHAKELFKRGEINRSYGSTKMNQNSSRSHVLVQFFIKTRFFTTQMKTYHSILTLADLAGSESASKANTMGERRIEGCSINRSLLALSKVIMNLSEGGRNNAHIGFRDSNLTRLLQPVLLGGSRIAVICTVSSDKNHSAETTNTIRFGVSAAGVKVTAAKSNLSSKSGRKFFGEEREFIDEEKEKLKDEITSLTNKNTNLTNDKEVLEEKVKFKEEVICQLKTKIKLAKILEEERKKDLREFEKLSQELSDDVSKVRDNLTKRLEQEKEEELEKQRLAFECRLGLITNEYLVFLRSHNLEEEFLSYTSLKSDSSHSSTPKSTKKTKRSKRDRLEIIEEKSERPLGLQTSKLIPTSSFLSLVSNNRIPAFFDSSKELAYTKRRNKDLERDLQHEKNLVSKLRLDIKGLEDEIDFLKNYTVAQTSYHPAHQPLSASAGRYAMSGKDDKKVSVQLSPRPCLLFTPTARDTPRIVKGLERVDETINKQLK